MKYLELKKTLKENIFSFLDVLKFFPQENPQTVRTQLSRFAKKGLIKKIKKSLYCFDPKIIDELELATRLYQPSYISLETALNYYGMIPDITHGVTSVNLTNTKKIKNTFGIFYYTKIKAELFFGFIKVKSPTSDTFFNLATKEKALLDYFYLRKVNTVEELRLNLEGLNFRQYQKWAKNFPKWVQKINLK